MKYLFAFLLPLTVVVALTNDGWLTLLPVLFSFVAIPLLEALVGVDHRNLTALQRDIARKDRVYDAVLYLTVPVQWGLLIFFLYTLKEGQGGLTEWIGRTTAMGMMCGVYGINVAHELGHRTTRFEQALAKAMLASSLYLHFFIEHNRGHHRNVGTPEDPASARRGETVYAFWMRTLPDSFRSAWRIVEKERRRRKQRVWSVSNELIVYVIVQLALIAAIASAFGAAVLLCFLFAALMGILLLETVNYIEHYGLQRKKVNEHRYEDVELWHSWNSDHVIGRLLLFELTRHSDHHWEPSKHYQLLDSNPGARQMPAGYPSMMLLSLLPPAWFRVMDTRIGE